MTDLEIDSLVMATVNAPYGEKLDAATLARTLLIPEAMELAAAHVGSFFYDVALPLQRAFATSHGISPADLVSTAARFDAYSGYSWAGKTAA